MYIVSVKYQVDRAVIEAHLDEHLEWLLRHYESGLFVASGRKQPWDGSVILASSVDRERLDEALAEDPFATNGLVHTDVTEVAIARTAEGLEGLKG